jgi:hypothetical protein
VFKASIIGETHDAAGMPESAMFGTRVIFAHGIAH